VHASPEVEWSNSPEFQRVSLDSHENGNDSMGMGRNGNVTTCTVCIKFPFNGLRSRQLLCCYISTFKNVLLLDLLMVRVRLIIRDKPQSRFARLWLVASV